MSHAKGRCQVYFIGAGPGDPELLTIKGRRIITEADLVLYTGSLVPRQVVACAKPGAKVMDSSSLTLEQTHQVILATVRAGGLVARVHTGDPSLYGAAREQMRLLDREGIQYDVIPGVTAAFAAAAAAKVSFTVPEVTQTVIFSRAAGRTPVPAREDLEDLARHGGSLAVYLSASMVDQVQKALTRGGYPDETTVVMGYRIGWPDEQVIFTDLRHLAQDVKRAGVRRQAVFLVLPGEGRAGRSRLYDGAFSHGFRGGPGRPGGVLMTGVAVYALTRKGARLGQRVAEALGGDLFVPERMALDCKAQGFSSFVPCFRSRFKGYRGHVLVGASGVAVRALQGLMVSKDKDPAVVVLDQGGRYSISLLAGHLGGGNQLAVEVARAVGARPVITTATDVEGLPSVDMLASERGLVIANLEAVKSVNAAVLEGCSIQVHDPEERLRLRSGNPGLRIRWVEEPGRWKEKDPGIWVTWRDKKPVPGQLVLHPRCLVAGVGCHRGTAGEVIRDCIRRVFEKEGLSLRSLAWLASIEQKREEQGLLQAARSLRVDVRFFDPGELDRVEVPNPGDAPKKYVGSRSVCEAAAIEGARGGALIVPKRKMGHVTVAVALGD